MELRELKSFFQIAHEKSFSKAANILGYSQAALTIQIKQLEKELGVTLFDRLGKNTTLTSNGEKFLTYAIDILKKIDEAKDSLKESYELNSSLNIGTIPSFSLPLLMSVIKKYRELYPKVNINIVTDTPNILFDKLNSNNIDLVYLLDKKIYDSHFIKVLEKEENIVLVHSSKFKKFDNLKSIKFSNIANENFFLTEKDASYRFAFDNFLASKNIYIKPVIESGNTDFLIEFLENDDSSISLLPYYAVKSKVENGKLKVLDVKDFKLRLWRQLFHHKNKYITREMQAFIKLILEME